MLISTDLTFDQHVTSVSGQCFYQLCQLRSVRQSLDTESIATLISSFVSSRVDYCCSLLIGSPSSVTDKLQRVLNAAASIITNTKKYDSGLSCMDILHYDCHWLDVKLTRRIQFRVAAAVYQCLRGMAPAYLTELCTPVTASASRRGGLRSQQLNRTTLQTVNLYGTRAFSVAGPVCWNALPPYTGLFKIIRSFVRLVETPAKTFFICRY